MNLRPPGYEPDELPSCSTPRHSVAFIGDIDYYTLFQQFCQEGAESFFAAEAEDENAAADLLSRKPAATLYWFYLLQFSKIRSITISSKPGKPILRRNESKCQGDHLGQKCSNVAAQFPQSSLHLRPQHFNRIQIRAAWRQICATWM